MLSRSDRNSTWSSVNRSMVRITADRERPRRSKATTVTVSPAHIVQQRGQAGPVLAGPGQLVGEDPCAPGGGQRVVLGLEGLMVGGDPRVPDDHHAMSVVELGALIGFDAPGFGPSSATNRPGLMLFERVSVGVVAEPWK